MLGPTAPAYQARHAAYDLKKLRAKGLIGKVASSRRYQAPPEGLRTIAALVVLRDKVIKPILAGTAKPTMDPRRERIPWPMMQMVLVAPLDLLIRKGGYLCCWRIRSVSSMARVVPLAAPSRGDFRAKELAFFWPVAPSRHSIRWLMTSAHTVVRPTHLCLMPWMKYRSIPLSLP